MENNVDKQYLDLLRDILENGRKKADRTGVGTISVFGRQLRFNMKEGFPLLTTKKLYTRAIVHELLWFLKGGDNIKYLVDNGVNIWNEWPWQAYMKERDRRKARLTEAQVTADTTGSAMAVSIASKLLSEVPALTLEEFAAQIKEDEEFAEKWGQLGPVYGKQWVGWDSYKIVNDEVHYSSINQIDQVIDDLKNNPDSRRIMVNAWNVGQIPEMKLPPCHWAFQLWTRELEFNERLNYIKDSSFDKMIVAYCENPSDSDLEYILDAQLEKEQAPKRAVSLMFQMRSVDCFLGMPFDIASYGILLEMIAQVAGMVPGDLLITSGDTHIYLNHLEQVDIQLGRTAFAPPRIELNKEVKNIYDFKYEDIKFVNYQAHPSIKADVAI